MHERLTNPASTTGGTVYTFDGWAFDPVDGTLVREGRLHQLTPRESATLACLVSRAGHLVDKQTLMREVWADLAVEENNLNQQVSRLRRVLGPSRDGGGFIETVARRGYRFVGTVVHAPVMAGQRLRPPSTASQGGERGTPRRNRRSIPFLVVVGVLAGTTAWATWSLRGERQVRVPTLVVLPVDNLTGDPANDYLAAGLTDAITTEVSRAAPETLRVVARHTVVRHAAGPGAQPRDVAARVGADIAVRTRLVRDGTRVRVSVQLVDVARASPLWARPFDSDVSGVLAAPGTLVRAVLTGMPGVMPASSRHREPPGGSPEARDLYLRARYFHMLATVPSIERAIGLYQDALEADPTFALAHAGLSRAYVFSTRTRPAQALRQARDAAQQARLLAPRLPEAQLAWAIAALYADRDLPRAEREFARAIAMDPTAADPHFYYAQMLTAAGRFDEALASARRALAIEPFSPLIHHYLGRIQFFARRPAEAVATLRETLDLDPNYPWTRMFLAVAYEQAGDYERALVERERYWALMGVPAARAVALRHAFVSGGYAGVRREWLRWIDGFEQSRGFVTSLETGLLHAALGDDEAALAALERGVRDGVRDVIYLDVYPELDRLRALPAFAALRSSAFP